MMSGPLQILLVEDDVAHAELIRRSFASHETPVHVTVARSLQEAGIRLNAFLPHIAIIDLLLPDGQGLDLLQLEGEKALYPVVIMTSHGNEQAAVEVMKAGALDYVVKSEMTLAEIPHVVDRALREWEQITERKRVEEALRRSEERYRELFENANDILYTHDLAGNFTSLNRAAERILGYSRREMREKNIVEMVTPEYRPIVSAMLDQQCAALSSTPCEMEVFAKDGQRVTLEVSMRLIYHEGEPVGVQGIGRDITERKHLEAQLRQAQKMEAIGVLAGGIAHDFNNILAAILGYTELALYEAEEDSMLWSNLQNVLTAADRAKDLVQQMLTFSRQTAFERQPVQLNVLVQEALNLVEASLPSTIAIQRDITADDSCVLADPTQIHQLLFNLCANAEHAMRATGGILEIRQDVVEVDEHSIALRPELHPGTYARLTVRDSGYGMAPETLEHIFEPFFTTKPPGEGTGMGLAMVHGIVTSCGGVLQVDSAPGQGTTFEIYLPRFQTMMMPEPRQTESLFTGTGCILFVDDEPPLAALGQEMLTRLGYEVVLCTSSVAALDVFRAEPDRFNLVITDQTMPQMTGEVLSRELRRIRPTIPIILCTGFSHVMNADKAAALGVDAFCMKPVAMHDLARTIQRVMT